MNIDFCRYGLAGCGKRCCFLCPEKCKLACTLKCKALLDREKVTAATASGHNVIIHYAKKNQMPDPRWRGLTGVLLITGRGRGPRNVLVETAKGTVVVPRLNARYLKDGTSGIRAGANSKY